MTPPRGMADGLDVELTRAADAVLRAVAVADRGTDGDRAAMSSLIDRAMVAEAARDGSALRAVAVCLASVAEAIERRAPCRGGPPGVLER